MIPRSEYDKPIRDLAIACIIIVLSTLVVVLWGPK
jgi:hypothetical protein